MVVCSWVLLFILPQAYRYIIDVYFHRNTEACSEMLEFCLNAPKQPYQLHNLCVHVFEFKVFKLDSSKDYTD